MKLWQKIITVFATFALLLNSLAAPLAVLAQTEPTPIPTETASPTPQETATPSPTNVATPSATPEATATPTQTLTENPPEPTTTSTPSASPTATPTATATATPTPSPWTFEKVELNKEYIDPQNSGVKLTFTKLPNPSGNIKITEITLTPDQIKQTGSLSDKAYDITSDMADGSFAYNLSLPIPDSSKGKAVDVKFAEDVSAIGSAKKVENATTKTDTSVSVSKLDHFTIFVVTSTSATYSSPWFHYPTQGYQNGGVNFPTTIPGGQTATWSFTTLPSSFANYDIYVSWSTDPNRTTSASYALNYAGSSVHQFNINQRELADQVTTGGPGQWSGWFKVGSYSLNKTSSLILTSVNNSSGTDFVIADSVAIVDTATAPNEVWVNGSYSQYGANDYHVWGYDAFTSIQSAITAVAPGGTVNVAAGNYTEDPVINKPLYLFGPNATINPNTGGSRNTEAIITGQITDNASNTDIKGFKITNPAYGGPTIKGVYVFSNTSTISSIDIENNIFNNIANSLAHGSYGVMVQGEENGVIISNNLFENISSQGWAHALEVTPTGTNPVVPQNVTIEGNTFTAITNTSGTDQYAFSVDSSSGIFADASQITFHNNSLLGNVRNLDTAHELNATDNNWGTTTYQGIEDMVDHNCAQWKLESGFSGLTCNSSDSTLLGIVNYKNPLGGQKYINFSTPSASSTYGGTNTIVSISVNAKYDPYGVSRVHLRYAPPGGTCVAQYTSPYYHDLGDLSASGDIYTGNWDVSGLTSGTYKLCALMHIGSGLSSEGYTTANSTEVSVTVDNTAPTGSWITPTNDSNVSGVVTLNFAAADDVSGVQSVTYQYKKDNGVDTFHDTGSSWDTTGLPLDNYILRATATDNAGNSAGFDETVGVSAVITNEAYVSLTTHSASVTWTTDRPTTSRVVYDTVQHGSIDWSDPNYGYAFTTGTSDTDPKVYSHTVIITDLPDGTNFFFRPVSTGSPTAVGYESYFRTFFETGPGGPPAPSSGRNNSNQVLGINTSWPKIAYAGNAPEIGNTPEIGSGNVLGTEATVEPSPTPEVSTPIPANQGLFNWILTHKKIDLGVLLIILAILYGIYQVNKKRRAS